MKTLLLSLILTLTAQSHATGGMIGGGDGTAYLCHSNPYIDDFYMIHIERKDGETSYLVSVESAAGEFSGSLEVEKSASTEPEGTVYLFRSADISLRIFADQAPDFPQFNPKANAAIVDFATFPPYRSFQNTKVDCEKI